MNSVHPTHPRPHAAAVASARRGPHSVLAAGAFMLAAVVALSSAALARPVPQSFADLAEKVAPAVVDIQAVQKASTARMRLERDGESLPSPSDPRLEEFFERFSGRGLPNLPRRPDRPRPATGVGSGFIMHPEGYIVTNNHVVAEADEVSVTLKDGRSFDAELIGRDERTDLALLKIEAGDDLPYVSFGDSDDVRVGDWVMAVGNPFGLGGTVTAGIVSARGRDLAGGTLIDFLQIDAAINRGNSGGPAFNDEGEVIGVNAAIFTPNGGNVGIGFAIPSNLAERIVAELRENGRIERGWLGVRIQPVNPEIAEGFGLDEARGALIASLESGGPAEKAGLEAGDVVLSWDGQTVKRFKDLPRLVAATPAGREVEVEVWRDGAETTVKVETSKMPERERVAAVTDERRHARGTETVEGTGLTVASLTPRLREAFKIGEDQQGVVVIEVEAYSPAARQGLREGDVITSIALRPVKTAGEAAETIDRLRRDGRPVAMLMVSRQGAERFFALHLADA